MCFFLSGNASICRPMSDASILRDTNWATQTCIIGCNTIGVWPESYDGTDVRVCAKSKTNNLLVAGDEGGCIRLFTSPSIHLKVTRRKLFHILIFDYIYHYLSSPFIIILEVMGQM